MLLENATPYPAMLFRGGVDESRLFCAVICRVTYDIEGTRLEVAPEQTWKVSAAPWEGPYGPMDSDEVFYRGGVDLFAFGCARPERAPAPSVDVSIEIAGVFKSVIRVFGRRKWLKRKGRLVMSPPEPFIEIPLTLANAYGGKDLWDGLEVPFPANPSGKGFFLEEAHAEGGELPHIEDPSRLISAWDDRPDPVGVAPCGMAFGPRLASSVVVDENTGGIVEIKPTLFNAAFPAMVAPRARAQDRVVLRGMSRLSPVEFVLPQSGLAVRLRFGDTEILREPAIDQIGIEVDKKRVFITYRYPFRYVYTPMVKRSCELILAG